MASSKFTEMQYKAVTEEGKNVLVSASAGSGRTGAACEAGAESAQIAQIAESSMPAAVLRKNCLFMGIQAVPLTDGTLRSGAAGEESLPFRKAGLRPVSGVTDT